MTEVFRFLSESILLFSLNFYWQFYGYFSFLLVKLVKFVVLGGASTDFRALFMLKSG